MKKILTNKWFLIAIGLVLLVVSPALLFVYLATLLIVWLVKKYGKKEASGFQNKTEGKSIWTKPITIGRPMLWIVIFGFFALVGALVVALDPGSKLREARESTSVTDYPVSETQEQDKQPLAPDRIGEEGFLRFSGSDNVPVLIAVSLEDYEVLWKTLNAKDEYGLLEMAAEERIFGVSKGTKVRIIDVKTRFLKSALLKVRILEGVHPVDEDKIGRSGWVLEDWVHPE